MNWLGWLIAASIIIAGFDFGGVTGLGISAIIVIVLAVLVAAA
jgi:hypothetical protein